MSDFKAKMHQIRFRLGYAPDPAVGSLQRSTIPPSWIWGGLLLREGMRREGREEKEGEGREEGSEEGRVGEGREERGGERRPFW